MQQFIVYFLNSMPTADQWLKFLLVNIIALAAARNTVLRQEKRAERKAYQEELQQLEADRRSLRAVNQRQEQLIQQYWALIQQQSNQIEALTDQLNLAKRPHLN